MHKLYPKLLNFKSGNRQFTRNPHSDLSHQLLNSNYPTLKKKKKTVLINENFLLTKSALLNQDPQTLIKPKLETKTPVRLIRYPIR